MMTAHELIVSKSAWNRADEARMAARPAGYPRAAWRAENPIDPPISWRVSDGRRDLVLQFSTTPSTADLFVLTADAPHKQVARLDLTTKEAEDYLHGLSSR